jgi:hypothetical protein
VTSGRHLHLLIGTGPVHTGLVRRRLEAALGPLHADGLVGPLQAGTCDARR